MSSTPSQFSLPDLFATLPVKFSSNPYYREVSMESKAWIDSYNILPDRKRAFFIQGVVELLCAYAYPYARREQLRTACDFVSIFHLPMYN